ncbi:MAG: hypothetical protein NTY35_03900 [Planctomycetota bacterium]|nr:hypothetical protein [Planctomycetota bacterium]
MRLHVVLLAALLLASTARSQTQLVVGQYKSSDPRLEKMNLDGSGVANLFAPGNPFPTSDWLLVGVAIDSASGRVYWSHGSFGSGRIGRANLDGSGQTTLLSSLKSVRGLALDVPAGKMYWSNSPAAGNAGGLIERANLDGTGRETVYAVTPYDPSFSKIGRPTVDSVNGWVWFGTNDRVLRVNTDGPPFVARTMVTGLSTPTRIQVDVANGWIYGIDSDTVSDCVWRARYDDSGFQLLADLSPASVESSGLNDLALDRLNARFYVSDDLRDYVKVANSDGTNLQTVFTPVVGWSPSAITLDTSAPQALEDCNHNGTRDLTDITLATSSDCDLDGVPDECQGAYVCSGPSDLLYQPSNPAATARALGGVAPATIWTVFQPFDVPAGGWRVGEIVLDGRCSNYDPAGFQATLFPDIGGNYPNESVPIASGTGRFRFSTHEITVGFDVALPAGRHWVRLSGNGVYTAGVFTATSGLPSLSRSSAGNDFPGQPPIALRLREPRRFTPFCAGDGSANACPCGNLGATGRGCASSVPTFGALLTASGLASVSADGVVLTAYGTPASSTLYFQGTAQQSAGLGAVFGDGLRCVSGGVIRLGTKFASGGTSSYPGVGDPSVSARGLIPLGGGTRHYQAWYRNAAAFCTPSTFNLSNGLQIDWGA